MASFYFYPRLLFLLVRQFSLTAGKNRSQSCSFICSFSLFLYIHIAAVFSQKSLKIYALSMAAYFPLLLWIYSTFNVFSVVLIKFWSSEEIRSSTIHTISWSGNFEINPPSLSGKKIFLKPKEVIQYLFECFLCIILY